MTYAYRVTLEYDGERFALKSMRRLAMRAPRGQSAREIGRSVTGRFVELRSPGGEVLYRRGIDQLIPATVEYPTGDPSRPFGRVKAPRRTTLSLVVPARDGALTMAIVEVRTDTEKGRTKDAQSATRNLFALDLPRGDSQ
jgi:hypothetical protein